MPHDDETRLRRGFGDGIFEVVHVRKRRHARPDHLRAAQPGTHLHELWRDEFTLDRHHITHQPYIQPQVVGQAAQQRHGDVRVRVNQAGNNRTVVAIDNFSSRVIAQDFIGRANGDNRLTLDGKRAVVDQRVRIVHGHQRAMRQNRIGFHLEPLPSKVRNIIARKKRDLRGDL